MDEIRFDGRDIDSSLPWDVRPNAMVNCDFGECRLSYVEFLGIDARSLTLPAKGRRVPDVSRVARNAYRWADSADVTPHEKRFLEMYWNGHVTKLPDDAEGWLDLDTMQKAGRALVERSMVAAT